MPERDRESPRTSAQRGNAPSFIDPRALMRIKSLALRAKVVVEGFAGGLHRSPYHGFSAEFSEYRQYSPGDDLRYLDWKLYARSDRYYLKRFEDETNVRCHLVLDVSRSMGYGSISYTKADYARTAVATLAYFLSKQRDAVGLVTFDQEIVDYLPARYRPGHLHRIMLSLERAPSGTATRLTVPLDHIARTVAKRGIIVIVSDLLAPLTALETHLGYLRARGHDVIILRVLDPAERGFTFTGPAMFHDVESGRNLYVDPDTAREEYLRRFADHAAVVSTASSSLGIDYYDMTTERPLELVLFDFISARLRRGRQIARHEARGRA